MHRLVRAYCSEPVASSRDIAIWAAFIGVVHRDTAMARVHRDGYSTFRLLLEEIIRDLRSSLGEPPDPVLVSRHAIAANAVLDGIWLEVSLDRDAFDDLDIETLALESIDSVLRASVDRKNEA